VLFGPVTHISPIVGAPSGTVDISAKKDTIVYVNTTNLIYNSQGTIDPFFVNQINGSATTGQLVGMNISITGNMRSSIGGISTQSLNFNFSHFLPGS